MLLWILFVVSIIFIYVKIIKRVDVFKERNIPYDTPMIFFGSMYRIFFKKVSFADGFVEIYNKNKKHKYFGMYNFYQPTFVIRDPEILKQIGIKEFDSFLDHVTYIDEELDPLFGKNVFSLKGQKWRQMRSTLSPAFTSSKMKSMFVLMSESANRFTDYFLKKAEANQHITVELRDAFTRHATDVIATCAFGLECDSLKDQENEFYLAGKKATDFSGLRGLIFIGYNLCPWFLKLFKIRLFDEPLSNFFRDLVTGTMNIREEKRIVRPDMIQLLMQAKKGNLKYEENIKNKDEDTGFATVEESEVGRDEKLKFKEFTHDDLTAQVLIFFFAGFDSTSILLCHMANELAVNPDVHHRLQAEVDETLENCKDGKITYDALTKMKYLDMVVCETLRKWSPSPVTDRLCTKSITIKINEEDPPLVLKKGDIIWFPTYAMHRDPEFFPDPDRFDPERFNDKNKDKIVPFSFSPFGIGPRNCIGSRFVLLEAKVVFVYLLSKFDITVDEKTQIPLKLSRSTFNMIAEKGFWVGLKPRSK